MNKCLVLGGAGFIGHHLCNRLMEEGYYVVAMDIQYEQAYTDNQYCHVFLEQDAGSSLNIIHAIKKYKIDTIFNLAAAMGGAGFIFTGDNDCDIMTGSARINIAVSIALRTNTHVKLFYSSSACVYPEELQMEGTAQVAHLHESYAYPANPDSEYGWEKLFSERLFLALKRNYGVDVRIARFHNIYGPECQYNNGREKAPAAICRKVLDHMNKGDQIEIWGDGNQKRSFLYIDDCLDAILALTFGDKELADEYDVYNIGSEEDVTINKLVMINCKHNKIAYLEPSILEYDLTKPQGVRARNSCNSRMYQCFGWVPDVSLHDGTKKLYDWMKKVI